MDMGLILSIIGLTVAAIGLVINISLLYRINKLPKKPDTRRSELIMPLGIPFPTLKYFEGERSAGSFRVNAFLYTEYPINGSKVKIYIPVHYKGTVSPDECPNTTFANTGGD